jgi:predicted lipoprotein with Yx(FWY)xxD motif
VIARPIPCGLDPALILKEIAMSGLARRVGVSAVAVAGVVTLAACGGSYKSESKSESKPATQPAAAGAALVSVKDAKLGSIVTDAAGFTLYRFDKDSAKPPTSNCVEACATAWPPATVSGDPALTGIDKSLVGTLKRADGTTQLTLKGWALYRFAGDTAPGQTNGQGVGGTWFVANPSGGKALEGTTTAPASDSTDTPADKGSDYSYSY